MNVSIFIPCFIDQLYPTVAFNMVKVLEKLGCNCSLQQQSNLLRATGF